MLVRNPLLEPHPGKTLIGGLVEIAPPKQAVATRAK